MCTVRCNRVPFEVDPSLPSVSYSTLNFNPESFRGQLNENAMSHNPTEHVQEELTHHASHGSDNGHGGKWITAAATTAAILAAFAAAAGALATSHLTQSTLIRIKAND